MRRLCLVIILVAGLPGVGSIQAAAILGGFATEITQIANKLQLLMSYIRQGEELTTKIKQYEDMLKHTKELPAQIFAPILADLAQLHSIVQTGRAIAYSLGNLDAEFRGTFKGYASWTPRQWFRDYKSWSDRSLDTTLGTLKAAGLQANKLNSEQAVLGELRTMATTSDGRLKALQVGNQIAHEQVEQLMKLRQLVLADLQSKQAFQAMMIQQEASKQAASEQFFRFGTKPGDGVTFVPGR